MKNEQETFINEIIENCTDCGACSKGCPILTEIDESPAVIAARGASLYEAFACSLCYRCEAVCPLNLNPGQMFKQKRIQAVADREIEIDDYRYLLPDRQVTVNSFYREYYGINYDDLNLSSPAEIGFFPGCTLMTYSPQLTRKVYQILSKEQPGPVFFTECCGKPLYQIGLPARGNKSREKVRNKIISSDIKCLVAACPNCYYELKQIMAGHDIKIITVYEALEKQGFTNHLPGVRCTIHDSCPDRFEGIFGMQVRQALESIGCQVVEMANRGKRSICCGSGGQLSHFQLDFAEQLVNKRLKEAEKTEADTLVAYCLSCVLNFSRKSPGMKVRHALNLLLGCDEDYGDLKNKANEMFTGPDGAENWSKIMDGPEED